jgi:hypothetical protein
VQRTLLLAGLSWISLGVTAIVVLSALLAHPSKFTETVPQGLQWIGVAPVGIGISHLIVYLVGKKNEPEPAKTPFVKERATADE